MRNSTSCVSEIDRRRGACGTSPGEIGDVLFCVVNVCRYLEIDPERRCEATNAKFERRFRYVERA